MKRGEGSSLIISTVGAGSLVAYLCVHIYLIVGYFLNLMLYCEFCKASGLTWRVLATLCVLLKV